MTLPLESLEIAPCTSHNQPADGGKGTAAKGAGAVAVSRFYFDASPLSSAKQVARFFSLQARPEENQELVLIDCSPPFLFEFSSPPCLTQRPGCITIGERTRELYVKQPSAEKWSVY